MPEMKTEKYKVLKQLEHDGKSYSPGAQIELQQGNADYLLRKGMIGKMEQLQKKTAAGNTGSKGSEA
jgi:hypothetical protein